LENSEPPHKTRPTDAAAARFEPARPRRAEWLVGEDKPDRRLLPAVQEVRLIIEPAAAALAAVRATGKVRQRIHAALAAMEASHDRATQAAADKAFRLAILDATHNPGGAGHSRRDRHDPERGIVVAVDSIDGWLKDKLANHAATGPRHRRRRRRKSRHPMEQVHGFKRSKLSRRKAGAGRRNGLPGGSRSLRKR
jgi:GntR family transcriptional regulator, galactonate operon transcriptional repressor